ncbi:MAG: NDP-hexose 4-ketoreductase, partial [Actinomycetota bacterium]|nr:NDP-hexose 4-ketoreductase [Actinomycetota bacterium]
TDDAKKLLARRGFDPVLGARPLRRTIQREIEDQLSEKILFNEFEAGQTVAIDAENFDSDDTSRAAQNEARLVFCAQPEAAPDVPDTVPTDLSEQ